MCYFYILNCSDGNRYYGHTNNLENRMRYRSNGSVNATKNKGPIELIYYEIIESRSEAFRREMKFKNGKTRKETIDKLINNFDKAKCQGFNSHLSLTSL